MKSLRLIVVIAVSVLTPLAASPPSASGAETAVFALSHVDQAMIQAQEFSEWMAHHRTPVQLRDMNQSIEHMCDRLQDCERRMNSLADDPFLRADKPKAAQIQRFGENIGTVGRELCGLAASIKSMAASTSANEVPASAAELDRYRAHQGALLQELAAIEKHAQESHAWVIEKPATRGLDEMSRDLDLARGHLKEALQAMDRLSGDVGVASDRVREMELAMERARATLKAIGEAQDRIADLAKAL